MLLITLHLEKFDYHMTLKDLKAKVVRCEYPLLEGEQYKIGVSFEGLSGRIELRLQIHHPQPDQKSGWGTPISKAGIRRLT